MIHAIFSIGLLFCTFVFGFKGAIVTDKGVKDLEVLLRKFNPKSSLKITTEITSSELLDAILSTGTDEKTKETVYSELAKLAAHSDSGIRKIIGEISRGTNNSSVILAVAKQIPKEDNESALFAQAMGIAWQEEPGVLPELRKFFEKKNRIRDSDLVLFRAVFNNSGKEKEKEAKHYLLGNLDDSTMSFLIQTLTENKDSLPAELLINLIDDKTGKYSSYVKSRALQELREFLPIPPEKFRRVLTLLDSEIDDMQANAFLSLFEKNPNLDADLPLLLKQIESDRYLNKITAIRGLSLISDPKKVTDALTKILRVPMSENDREREKARELFNESVKSLVASKADPESYISIIADRVVDWISPFSSLPRLEMLRHYEEIHLRLNDDKLRRQFDLRVRNSITAQQNKLKDKLPDTCKLACDLAKKTDIWLGKEYLLPEFSNKGIAWEMAMKSLGALFLAKAANVCPEAKQRYNKLKESWFAEKPTTHSDKVAPPPRPKENLTPEFKAIMEETKKNMKGPELEKFENMMRAIDSGSSERPPDAATVYGNAFYGLLLREMLRDPNLTPEKKRRLEQALVEAEKSHNRSLSSFDSFSTVSADPSERSDSLYNTYAFLSSINSMSAPHPAAMKRLWEMNKSLQTPFGVPYGPREGSESPRSGFARSVPFHLMTYLHTSSLEEKKSSQNKLIEALEYYVENTPAIASHVVRGGTHIGYNQLAPYYYYSTVPYAASALKILIARTEDEKTRTKLKALKTQLEIDLLTMTKADGLFLDMGEFDQGPAPQKPNPKAGIVFVKPGDKPIVIPKSYPSSPAYSNPLAGLALLPLIESCDGKPVRSSSLGIVDPGIEARSPAKFPLSTILTHD